MVMICRDQLRRGAAMPSSFESIIQLPERDPRVQGDFVRVPSMLRQYHSIPCACQIETLAKLVSCADAAKIDAMPRRGNVVPARWHAKESAGAFAEHIGKYHSKRTEATDLANALYKKRKLRPDVGFNGR
jgi:hypothetical protein